MRRRRMMTKAPRRTLVRWRHSALVTLAVGVVVVVWSWRWPRREARKEAAPAAAEQEWRRRVERYCEAPVLSGAEGLKRLVLLGVTATIRHGARSAIHEPLEVLPASFDCETSYSTTYSGGIPRAPAPATKDGKSCEPGQLVERGFRQHYHLGARLRRVYDMSSSSWTAYARSTRYQRTKASAAAFLAGAGFVRGPRFDVWGSQEETDPMLGARNCAKATRDARRQNDAFATSLRLDPRYHTFSSSLGKNNNETLARTVCEVADAFYSRQCELHRAPLCLNDGTSCLDDDQAAALLREADRFYCERYLGDHGGRAASRLAMYPFLRELADGLRRQATAQNRSLRLYSGHDTVVAPVAAALGFFDCKWPPLASHILFELYAAEVEGPLLRIVYNGRPVPVLGCSATAGDGTNEDHLLCPLAAFSDAVDGLLGDDFADFKRACQS